MTDLNLIPGELNISIASINDMPILLDFDIDLSGYTFASAVKHAATSTTITVTNTDLSAGQVTISLTDAQIGTIGGGTHKWYFKWNDGTNDFVALAGSFKVLVY